jgi:hypothetical protein
MRTQPSGAVDPAEDPVGVEDRQHVPHLTVEGPRVTPDVDWEATGLPDFVPGNPVSLLTWLR